MPAVPEKRDRRARHRVRGALGVVLAALVMGTGVAVLGPAAASAEPEPTGRGCTKDVERDTVKATCTGEFVSKWRALAYCSKGRDLPTEYVRGDWTGSGDSVATCPEGSEAYRGDVEYELSRAQANREQAEREDRDRERGRR